MAASMIDSGSGKSEATMLGYEKMVVKERSIEVKVGPSHFWWPSASWRLFVLVMGQVSFQPKFTILRRLRQPRRPGFGLGRTRGRREGRQR